MRSLALLALVALLGDVRPAGAVGPGEQAPEFTLQDVSNSSYTLTDFRGKVVLLALVGWG